MTCHGKIQDTRTMRENYANVGNAKQDTKHLKRKMYVSVGAEAAYMKVACINIKQNFKNVKSDKKSTKTPHM